MKERLIPAGRVDLSLLLFGLVRPRYWSQVPWRLVSLLNKRMGDKMRNKWRAKQ